MSHSGTEFFVMYLFSFFRFSFGLRYTLGSGLGPGLSPVLTPLPPLNLFRMSYELS